MAYYNTKHLPAAYAHKNAHRTKCPKCNTPRCVFDPASQKMIPAKVIYHFPLKHFIRGLFRRVDLVPHLWWDSGDPQEGSVLRSRGFKQKVIDNPAMNADHRSIALIGTTDGVTFFDDQRRGGWPFFFRFVCVHNLYHDVYKLMFMMYTFFIMMYTS
jgi:hypothetical protein